ncbi:MAG: methyltransferase domain-containing protein [Elusimicrobiales bacterium]|nr:methyltransferase domain-containing protein [Elusimicrobiales bacterium]
MVNLQQYGLKDNKKIDFIFNSSLCCAVISCFYELGIFELIQNKQRFSLQEISKKHKIDENILHFLFFILESFEIIKRDKNEKYYTKGKLFGEIFQKKSFFYWLVSGYYKMLSELPQIITTNKKPYKNWKNIAIASEEYGANFVWKDLKKAIKKAIEWTISNQKPQGNGRKIQIVDLGCGTGHYLIKINKDNDITSSLNEKKAELFSTGINISASTIEIAKKITKKEGLHSKIDFIVADIQNLFHDTNQKNYLNADIIMSIFTIHEFLQNEGIIFEKIRKIFPKAEIFILCDNYKITTTPNPTYPIYSLALEFTHAIQKTHIPTLKEWYKIFTANGWKPIKILDTKIENAKIFILKKI